MRPLLLAIAVAALGALLAACRDDDDAPSGSPTGTASGTPTASAGATITDSPQLMYTDPSGSFMFPYLDSWTLETFGDDQVRVSSFDFDETSGRFPDGGVLVDVLRIPLEGLATRPPNAVAGTLGGDGAWVVEQGPTGGGDATWKWEHWVGAPHGDHAYVFVGYFGDPTPDQSLFLTMLAGFEFLK